MHIRDPIHGAIEISADERALVDSPQYQRLRNVKQLGFADLAFPGATHTRYAHGLGAMAMATKLFDALAPQLQLEPADRDRFRQTLRLAVLFHDLGHAPLSHATEAIMPDIAELRVPDWAREPGDRRAGHEDYTLKLLLAPALCAEIRRRFSTIGIEPEHVAGLICGRPSPGAYPYRSRGRDLLPILRQVVSGELDADRMDYLQRDSFFTGVNYGKFDADWIVQNLAAVERDGRVYLALLHRAVFEFEDFLLSRYHMFLSVYFHSTSVGYEVLPQRCCESGEYALPADPDEYLLHDDVALLGALRSSQNPWARRVEKLGGILDVAKALVAERDLDRLLKLIVHAAARVVEADRCSLFLVDRERGELWTKVAQGIGTKEIRIPIDRGIAGAVATTNAAINIPDAYKDPRFNQNVDKQTGYKTRNILCVPMRSVEGDVVGVLQALNKLDGKAFTDEDEELLFALGGQAAAAVNNALLHHEIEQLFEGFVRASVVAIEARDPTTAGHSGRVARLSVGLGDMLPRAGKTAGRWTGSSLTAQERQELRYAAMLHDFGKVGVRENVLVKANKLEPLELENLRGRFETIFVQEELAAERQKVDLLLRYPTDEARARVAEVNQKLEGRRRELSQMFEFVVACNRPTILTEGTFDKLHEIARGSYVGPFGGEQRPFLAQSEIIKLSIRKGSLTE